MKKIRADLLLAERGLADSPARAQALIMAGLVASAGRRVDKAGELLPADAPLAVEPTSPFVGRGGLKLAEALDAFGVSPAGRTCADIGVSTGGFTDCLLQGGAARVFAVDVSIRQIDDRLRRDPRVVLIEKNARNLRPDDFSAAVGLAVMDVSFISILKILPALAEVFRAGRTAVPDPILLSLIKPQFEAEKGRLGPRGIVRDPAVHAEVLSRIARDARLAGFRMRDLLRLKTRGQKGNQEFFARFAFEPAEEGGDRIRLEPLPKDVLEWISAAIQGGGCTESGGGCSG
jgi:23S rRNA (cytidine1920-2'-O)/16S rRNA (cytidine1409-2'-O)-methyltransferase